MAMTKEDLKQRIENDFVYHKPIGSQQERYVALRNAGKSLALLIVDLSPISREQSVALTHLEEVIMWANAGIARNEGAPPEP